MSEAPSNHYVDNKRLFEAIMVYKAERAKALADGKPSPRIPEYVGACILAIAQNVAKMPRFYNYPFKADMISDGVENCCMYFHNFNEEKTQNPFNYFTTIIYYAFLRRIQKEKKQLYIKQKVMQHSIAFNEMFDISEQDMDDGWQMVLTESTDKMNDFTNTYEAWVQRKKERRERKVDSLETTAEEAHFELEDLTDGTEIESPDTWDDPGMGETGYEP